MLSVEAAPIKLNMLERTSQYEYENEEERKYSERSLDLLPYLKGKGWAKLFGQQCAVFLAEYLVSYRC
jgi:hypothetical protein